MTLLLRYTVINYAVPYCPLQTALEHLPHRSSTQGSNSTQLNSHNSGKSGPRMVASVSERCHACITTLKAIVSILSGLDRQTARVHHEQVNDELERFSLWMGNIGSLHPPESTMSLESRLRGDNDVLTHILDLLDDLNMVAGERGSASPLCL